MLQIIQAFICENLTIDQTTNNVSAFGIVDQITVPPDAFVPNEDGSVNVAEGALTLFALFSWEWPERIERRSTEVMIRITTPRGNHYLSLNATKIDQDDETFRHRLITEIGQFPLDEPGFYVFTFIENGVDLHSIPLKVVAEDETPNDNATGERRAER